MTSRLQPLLPFDDKAWSVHHGDVFEWLPTLPPGSVHCVMSSPPYFGLRDYGIPPRQWDDGTQSVFGLEETPEAYVRHTVELFYLLGRVLRDDGVIWWNIGDTFSTYNGAPTSGKHVMTKGSAVHQRRKRHVPALSKLMIPHRVALALQEAGWVVRMDVIWSKPSPMPESVRGVEWRWEEDTKLWSLTSGAWRPTTAHEYVLMIAKTPSYFCDATAVAEKAKYGVRGGYRPSDADEVRNPRSVWTIAAEPTMEKHFAAYPTELVRRCVAVACSRGGVCSACGAQSAPLVRRQRAPTRPGADTKITGTTIMEHGKRDKKRHVVRVRVEGYRPTCDCGRGLSAPIVLDPFAGTGTTLQVAVALGCRAIGCELGAQYLPIIERRMQEEPRCLRTGP